MKKSALLLATSVVLLLSSCGGGTTTSSSGSTSTSTSTSQSSGSSSSSTETSTSSSTSTTIPDPIPVGIQSIISKPDYILKGEIIDPSTVRLLIELDNGGTIEKSAESVECDTSSASKGDVLTAVAHYKTFTKEFSVTVVELIDEELTVDAVSGISGTYQAESVLIPSPVSGAKYKARMIKKNDIYYGEEKSADYKLSFTNTNDKGQPGLSIFGANGAVAKVTINWATGKDKVESSGEAKYRNEGKKIYLFAGENDLPFVDVNDLKLDAYKVGNAIKVFEFDPAHASQTFMMPGGVHYIGIKSSGSVYLDSLVCSWSDVDKPATLNSMTLSGTVHAECSADDTWNFENVTVKGKLSNTREVDVTRYCSFSSTTPVPTSHVEGHQVSVKSTYLPDTTKTQTTDLNGTAIEVASIELSGTVSSSTGETSWNFENVRAIATYNDNSIREITDECDFSSTTPIPLTPVAEMDVVVNAQWQKDVSKTGSATLKGSVEQSYPTAASWAYPEVATGGDFTKTNLKNDTTNKCVTENSAVDAVGYIQVLNGTEEIMNAKSATLTALIGAGSAKEFTSEDYYVKASLLDASGNEITNTTKVLAASLVKEATEYTVIYSEQELSGLDVYGVRISHKKVSGYNIRLFSFELKYDPAE
ncbi:MAG: hypothetical protein MJ221_00245 [Bacilli bacterium]|nr:hypothetical protein [Bacilli bacterium]